MTTDQNPIKKHQQLTAEKTGPIYFRFLQEDGRPIFATVGGGHERPFTAEEIEENARRLVACVNACAGISTDDLELYYNAGGGLDEAMEEASLRDHVNAVRQRDELLAALGIAQAALNCARMNTPAIVSITVEKYADYIDSIKTVEGCGACGDGCIGNCMKGGAV